MDEPELPTDPPRIYVASLSDYNAGVLHGTWMEANDTADDLAAAAQAMLASSPTDPLAEEWAIHDYEGFCGIPLSEWEPMERIAKLGAGIVQHGEAFAAWVTGIEPPDDVLDTFEEVYVGTWDSLEDYAQSWIDDCGTDLETLLPEHLRPYVHIDLEALGRDLAADGEVVTRGQRVYVFVV